MNKIPICHYVAYNNPEGAKKILEAWGIPVKGTNKKGLAESLQKLLRQEGEGVLMDIGNMHPDKDLVVTVEQMKAEKTENKNGENTSSCNGGKCSCMNCGEKKSNACGCGMSSFGGGSWNHNEGAFYKPGSNAMVDEFQVYGFDGEKKKVEAGTILFIGVSALLAYMLYKNG